MTERRFYAMPYPSGWCVMDSTTGERADEREFPGSIEANQWAGVLGPARPCRGGRSLRQAPGRRHRP